MKVIFPKDREAKKEYCWEASRIILKKEKLKKNPNHTLLSYKQIKKQIIIAPILYVLMIICLVISNYNAFIMLVFLYLILLTFIQILRIESIEKMQDTYKETYVYIAKDKLIYEIKDIKSFSIYLDNIEFILFKTYGIYVVPKDDSFIISIPIENKDEFKNELKKNKINIKVYEKKKDDNHD